MKKARITYHENYPPFGEGYAIEIENAGEYDLDSFFGLQHCLIDQTNDERNFIHYSILNKIKQLQELGYEVKIL